MNAVDTNVLVYRLDQADPAKQAKAKKLLQDLSAAGETILLWQAAGELTRQLSAWRDAGLLPHEGVARYLGAFRRMFPLAMPVPGVLDRALDLAKRHSLSHWDSMLVAAGVEAGIDRLYTEDMGAPRRIDGIELVNPFA